MKIIYKILIVFFLYSTLLYAMGGELFCRDNMQTQLLDKQKNNLILVTQDSLPDDIPVLNIMKPGVPSKGYYFISTNPLNPSGNLFGNYNIVVDNDGSVMAYKRIGINFDKIPYNFTQSKNGLFVYSEKTPENSAVIISDTAFTKEDTLNYIESAISQPFLSLLPNGNYLMVRQATRFVDLSKTIENGDPNSTVITNDIYELDRNHNIVFYWRALDYINIDDSYLLNPESLENVKHLDFINTNKLEMDLDGNLLISNAGFSDVIKIDKKSGDILWRLGGKNNEFTFIDESNNNEVPYFSGQHDIRKLPNGNITLFDNGTLREIKYSRAVEYELDESNKTCKLIWEYRHEPDIYSESNGSVQRLDNGNTVISWGNASFSGNSALTEVDVNSNVALELNLPLGYTSAQITKNPWAYSSPSSRVSFEILRGNTYTFKKGSQITCTKMKINDLQEIFYPMIFVNKYLFAPLNPQFNETQVPIIHPVRLYITVRGLISVNVEARFNLSCLGIEFSPESWKVYRRENPGDGVFEQLETIYDENTGELVINTSDFGEFIFGIPQPETKPKETLLIFPKNNVLVNAEKPIKLFWSPHGYFTDCNLQISDKVDFSDLLVDTTGLPDLNFVFDNLVKEKTYFWRVRSDNGNTKGDWSEVRQFKPLLSFIDITIPNGGESWQRDSMKKYIRWNKNVTDLVKIELLKEGAFYELITDSLYSPIGAYAWLIPDFVPEDSTYQIRVSSLKNNEILSESDGFFAINNPVSDVISFYNSQQNFVLKQNSPNPVNGFTQIEFLLPNSGRTVLTVYNLIGEELATILDTELPRGSHKINWDASHLVTGQYYYRLESGGMSLTKTMTVIK